jgi:uncharacterized alpha-E superfamily protein
MSAVRVDSDRRSEWESAIIAAGCREGYLAKHEHVEEALVIDFLVFDRDNPSSIANCIDTARRNARAVRTALTTSMWDAVQGTWQELPGFRQGTLDADRLNEFLEWIRVRVDLFHGVCSNSMLRRDGFFFLRTGQFLERADNVARLLDVKYHVRLPQVSDIGGVIDYYQWLAILKVVGARRAYRVLFKGRVEPAQVAELLITRSVFPRSLAFCFEQISRNLDAIESQDPQRAAEAKRCAHSLYADLRYANVDRIIENGLHEFLTDVIERTEMLGTQIARGHLFQ